MSGKQQEVSDQLRNMLRSERVKSEFWNNYKITRDNRALTESSLFALPVIPIKRGIRDHSYTPLSHTRLKSSNSKGRGREYEATLSMNS